MSDDLKIQMICEFIFIWVATYIVFLSATWFLVHGKVDQHTNEHVYATDAVVSLLSLVRPRQHIESMHKVSHVKCHKYMKYEQDDTSCFKVKLV